MRNQLPIIFVLLLISLSIKAEAYTSKQDTIRALVRSSTDENLEYLLQDRIEAKILDKVDSGFASFISTMANKVDRKSIAISDLIIGSTYSMSYTSSQNQHYMQGTALTENLEQSIINKLQKHYAADLLIEYAVVGEGEDPALKEKQVVAELLKSAYGVKASLLEVTQRNLERTNMDEDYTATHTSELSEKMDIHANYKVYVGSLFDNSKTYILAAVRKKDVENYDLSIAKRLEVIGKNVETKSQEEGILEALPALLEALDIVYFHKAVIKHPLSSETIDAATYFKDKAVSLLDSLDLEFDVMLKNKDSVLVRLTAQIPDNVSLEMRDRRFKNGELVWSRDAMRSNNPTLTEPIRLRLQTKNQGSNIAHRKNVTLDLSNIQEVRFWHETVKNGLHIYASNNNVIGAFHVRDPESGITKKGANKLFFPYQQITGNTLIASFPGIDSVVIAVHKPMVNKQTTPKVPDISYDLERRYDHKTQPSIKPKPLTSKHDAIITQLSLYSGTSLLAFIDNQFFSHNVISELKDGDHLALVNMKTAESSLFEILNAERGLAVNLRDNKPTNIRSFLNEIDISIYRVKIFNID